ncbi:MAG: PTS sugar transporter subunit IIA [Psychromonas sp.]|nr:PTS sugar transporter subunit IIA [Psychromonas sp.]
MKISSLLKEDLIVSQVACQSKKSALEIISHLAAEKLKIEPQILFNSLISREKIGSTGIGNGVAMPHVKIDNSLSAIAIFLQCSSPIDYDATDGQKVDLFLAFFIPEDQCSKYLTALPDRSKRLLDKALLKQLRHAEDSKTLLDLILSTD